MSEQVKEYGLEDIKSSSKKVSKAFVRSTILVTYAIAKNCETFEQFKRLLGKAAQQVAEDMAKEGETSE